MPVSSERGPRTWVIGLVVFAMAVIPFAASLDGPFLFDDQLLIAQNPAVQGFGNVRAWFFDHFWESAVGDGAFRNDSARYWRPACTATYALDWHLGGGSPLVFHATNLILHGANSLLAFLLLRRWTRSNWGAALGGALFALHPSRTENVAWISGRPDLLCALGIFCCLAGVARRLEGKRDGVFWEVLGTVVAYLAKETAVILPLLVSVELWLGPRSDFRSRAWFLRQLVPQVLGCALYGMVRLMWLPVAASPLTVPASTRIGLVLESYGRYLELVAWPHDLGLGRALVGATAGRPFVANVPFAILGAIGLFLLLVIVVRLRRRRPVVSLGLAFFLAALLPVVNVSLMPTLVLTSPRLLYLPLLGVGLALGGLCASTSAVGSSSNVPRLGWLALAALGLAASAASSYRRSLDYTSPDRFWAYELASNPADDKPWEYFASREFNARRPRAALEAAVRKLTHPGPDQVRFGPSPALVVVATEALLQLTPDLDRLSLARIADFLRSLRTDRVASLELPERGISFRVQPLHVRPYKLLMMEASARSRLGDVAATTEAAVRILGECNHCSEVFFGTFFAAGRARRLDLARSALREPRSLDAAVWRDARRRLDEAVHLLERDPALQNPVLRVQYLSLFHGWGLAYDAAAPAFEAGNELDAGTRWVLGALAFRAGDEAKARQLWEGAGEPLAIEERVEVLRREMGWVDAARPPEEAWPRRLSE